MSIQAKLAQLEAHRAALVPKIEACEAAVRALEAQLKETADKGERSEIIQLLGIKSGELVSWGTQIADTDRRISELERRVTNQQQAGLHAALTDGRCASTNAPTEVKNEVRKLCGSKCCLCKLQDGGKHGRKDGRTVTVAHILKAVDSCKAAGSDVPTPKELGNYLYLCGTRQANKGTPSDSCHDWFDSYLLSFVPIDREVDDPAARRWMSICTDERWNGKVLTLPTGPRRRAMRARTVQMCDKIGEAKLNELIGKAIHSATVTTGSREAMSAIASWIDNVSPDRSPTE